MSNVTRREVIRLFAATPLLLPLAGAMQSVKAAAASGRKLNVILHGGFVVILSSSMVELIVADAGNLHTYLAGDDSAKYPYPAEADFYRFSGLGAGKQPPPLDDSVPRVAAGADHVDPKKRGTSYARFQFNQLPESIKGLRGVKQKDPLFGGTHGLKLAKMREVSFLPVMVFNLAGRPSVKAPDGTDFWQGSATDPYVNFHLFAEPLVDDPHSTPGTQTLHHDVLPDLDLMSTSVPIHPCTDDMPSVQGITASMQEWDLPERLNGKAYCEGAPQLPLMTALATPIARSLAATKGRNMVARDRRTVKITNCMTLFIVP
jgi:hypothetical protein